MSETLSPESQPSFISISASEYARLVNAERKLKDAMIGLELLVAKPSELHDGAIKYVPFSAAEYLLNHLKS